MPEEAKTGDSWLQRLAAILNKNRWVAGFYGVWDGLNIVYSAIKWFLDILSSWIKRSLSAVEIKNFTNSSMHHWMLSPAGIIIAVLSSVFVVIFSVLGSYFKEDSCEFLWDPSSTDKQNDLEDNKLYFSKQQKNDGIRFLCYRIKQSGSIKSGEIPFSELTNLKPEQWEALTLVQLRTCSEIILQQVRNNGHIKPPNFFHKHLKKYFVRLWPYLRDIAKAAKNFSKGFSSLSSIVVSLGGLSLNFLSLPFALGVGFFAVANRIWYRRMKNKRKDMQDEADAIRQEILHKKCLSDKEANIFKVSLDQLIQTPTLKRKAQISAFWGGLFDGIYLYLGVMFITAIFGPVFPFLTAFSLCYVVISVISRMYEEFDYQQKLIVSNERAQLALQVKTLSTQMFNLEVLLNEQALLDEARLLESKGKVQDFIGKIPETKEKLLQCRRSIESRSILSPTLALLVGLRNGLAAYGAVSSVLFALGTILMLSSVAFPPALLIAGIALGMGCLIAFTVHSLVTNYRQRRREAKNDGNFGDLENILKSVSKFDAKAQKFVAAGLVDTLETQGLYIDPTPQMPLQEIFEVARSGLMGASKGNSTFGFVAPPLQALGDDNRYHPTSKIFFVAVGVLGIFYAIGHACRAITKGFSAKTEIQKCPSKKVLIQPIQKREKGGDEHFLSSPESVERKSTLPPNPVAVDNALLAPLKNPVESKEEEGYLSTPPNSPSAVPNQEAFRFPMDAEPIPGSGLAAAFDSSLSERAPAGALPGAKWSLKSAENAFVAISSVGPGPSAGGALMDARRSSGLTGNSIFADSQFRRNSTNRSKGLSSAVGEAEALRQTSPTPPTSPLLPPEVPCFHQQVACLQ